MLFNKPCYIYDIEIFQNFFSAIFKNPYEQLSMHEFVIFGGRDDRQELKQFLQSKKPILIGYNNLYFDDIIINAVLENYSLIQLYELGQLLINRNDSISANQQAQIKALRRKQINYESLDLMQIASLDGLVSLKQVGVNLKFPMIQDLPYPYDMIILQEHVPVILDYNNNDVLVTEQLFHELIPHIELRKMVSKEYNVDVMNSSESGIGNQIITQLYAKQLGLSSDKFRDLRSPAGKAIAVKNCIGENIEFQTTELKTFFKNLKKQRLPQLDNGRYRLDIEPLKYAGLVFNFGVGGLHSQDNSAYFKSDDKVQIIDCDVTSFYPNIILLNQLKPSHLDDCFLDIFRDMTRTRVEEKEKGNKLNATALKITVNAIFGKLGYQNFWLYDPHKFFTVTISGQLYLLMLVEYLTLNGIQVISANTDGIVSLVEDEESYKSACQEWMDKTEFLLDYTYYDIYARRDVNAYVAKSNKGRIKQKGIFEQEINFQKGYKYPIVSKALNEFFLNGQSPEETFNKSDSIYDFMISQKAGRKFKMVYRQNGTDIEIQQTNRYIVTTEGGELIKTDGDREISLCAGHAIQIVNKVEDDNPKHYPLDYAYYLEETEKIIRQIKPPVMEVTLI